MTKTEYTGGKTSYYEVYIAMPTREGREPYTAECNDIAEALGMTFAEGEAFKAIWRRAASRLRPTKEGYDNGLYDAKKVAFYGARMVIQQEAYGLPITHKLQGGEDIAESLASFGEQLDIHECSPALKAEFEAIQQIFLEAIK